MGAPGGRSIRRLGGTDPGDRFAERHDCGCEFSAGQWLPCAAHRETLRRELDRGALGALDAVLHAAPPHAWRSISAMRDYLLKHNVRALAAPD